MKNISIDWKLIAVAFFIITVLFIVIPDAPKRHTCIDATHKTCDSKCECDGMECGTHYHNGKECRYEGLECPVLSKALAIVPARDYQLEIVVDTVLVYEGTRLVGRLPLYSNNSLDSLLRADNDDVE